MNNKSVQALIDEFKTEWKKLEGKIHSLDIEYPGNCTTFRREVYHLIKIGRFGTDITDNILKLNRFYPKTSNPGNIKILELQTNLQCLLNIIDEIS